MSIGDDESHADGIFKAMEAEISEECGLSIKLAPAVRDTFITQANERGVDLQEIADEYILILSDMIRAEMTEKLPPSNPFKLLH